MVLSCQGEVTFGKQNGIQTNKWGSISSPFVPRSFWSRRHMFICVYSRGKKRAFCKDIYCQEKPESQTSVSKKSFIQKSITTNLRYLKLNCECIREVIMEFVSTVIRSVIFGPYNMIAMHENNPEALLHWTLQGHSSGHYGNVTASAVIVFIGHNPSTFQHT